MNEINETLIFENIYFKPEMIKNVVNFLNQNFKQSVAQDIDSNGYPIEIQTIDMIKNGQVLKTLSQKELLIFLDDKFNNIIKNKKDRLKFLKSIIIDWQKATTLKQKKALNNGLLNINFIN